MTNRWACALCTLVHFITLFMVMTSASDAINLFLVLSNYSLILLISVVYFKDESIGKVVEEFFVCCAWSVVWIVVAAFAQVPIFIILLLTGVVKW